MNGRDRSNEYGCESRKMPGYDEPRDQDRGGSSDGGGGVSLITFLNFVKEP